LRVRLLDEREPEPLPLALRDDDEPEPELLLRDDEPLRERDDEPPLPDELLREREDDEREDEPLPDEREDDEREDEPLPDERDDDEREDEPLPDERDDDDPLPLRDELDRLREDDERERPAGLRSAAGISSWATAFVSCGISFPRNFCIRSSSRRMPLAIFAVSLSPTRSASASIAV
jgi:hypothetical protein